MSLSCKQIADALGIRETKATQAWQPAIAKVARLMRLHPLETMRALSRAMEEDESDRVLGELPERIRRLNGGRECE